MYSRDELIQGLVPRMDVKSISQSGSEIQVVGKIRMPLEQNIEEIKRHLACSNSIPFFETEGADHVVHIRFGKKQSKKRSRYLVNLILFIATVCTTLIVGSFNNHGNPFQNPLDIVKGIPFSLSILLILGSHELGHYFTSRISGVDATLPYFLPVPHPLVGTLGAFIKIKSILPNRSALVRLGASGPIIGFLVAIPITVIGLTFSSLQRVEEVQGGLGLGSCLIFSLLSKIVFPHIPDGHELILHPVAFAGWVGFFVTSLNLIPLSQLDGGHIAYAVCGVYRKYVTIASLMVLGVMALFWPGWVFWGLVIVFILKLRHPPPQESITSLSLCDKLLAMFALAVLVLTFIPVPFFTSW